MFKPMASAPLTAVVVLFSAAAQAQQATVANETLQTMLAAQIRAQGFVCDKALGALRDKKRSRPDHAVWTLTCGNATYRISRAPDMAAKVEPVP
ncbi:hypothetical protein XI06_07900 [Bradyrhizobium sp. CCBAU 11434]|uniref:hypothetical protein n=1 Tax=Bradyrhizobium sp. CCBAU 11434 TaxID=1630885 RepID=UPI0023050622|nr:hypothetical protein [Bradyrhizobium sp. CCBAU 11434]MDA9520278.1 hypothetical protein [Bradyrhizobium sp. CCBAU 11434]